MSKSIFSKAIIAAHRRVAQAEWDWQLAMDRWGPNEPVGFPNTAYYLPVIYAILGIKIEKLGDIEQVLKRAKSLLPPLVSDRCHLPYLGPALDGGMATLFSAEIIEAINYLKEPDFYTKQEDPNDKTIWLGAADDVILRKRGVEFVDGTAPGFAAILGAAPTNEIAVNIAQELQKKNLYVFMASMDAPDLPFQLPSEPAEEDYKVKVTPGKRFAEQLVEAGVQIGWPTRLVTFGPEITAACFALGFAARVAMSFGGVEPGDYRKILLYNKGRVFSFGLPLSPVPVAWFGTSLACVNFGFPIISAHWITEVLPTGVCTYEHVVSNIPYDKIVAKAVEVRGLKITIAKVPIPAAYGPAFEGERIRNDDLYFECGGGRTLGVELTVSRDMSEVEDGKIEMIGPDLDQIKEGDKLPFAVLIEVAGRQMQPDFEPILERQIHHLVNYVQGIMHIGQRNIMWIRVGKAAVEKGFLLKHLGKVMHAKYHQDFGGIVDKVQVKIYTDEEKVKEVLELSKKVYKERDERVSGMSDETEETYYSCTLCQSFAPSHVCIITPERVGMCGAYNWLDCKASFEINSTGPNQPIIKGECTEPVLGQWKGITDFVNKASRQKVEQVSAYSLMNFPMTACGCFECVATILPMCNGIMVVNRDFMGMTPCGMKFTTLAGMVGGGNQTPGFLGVSKHYIGSRKFLIAEGGLKRVVWLPRMLKEEIAQRMKPICEEMGIPNFPEMIADETVGTTEEEILPFLEKKGHPALTMDPLM